MRYRFFAYLALIFVFFPFFKEARAGCFLIWRETGEVSTVDKHSAVLTGLIKPKGDFGEWWFEYGKAKTELIFKSYSKEFEKTDEELEVSSKISGLDSDTIYYYRLLTKNQCGTGYGDVYEFKTDPDPSPIISEPTDYFLKQKLVNSGGLSSFQPRNNQTAGLNLDGEGKKEKSESEEENSSLAGAKSFSQNDYRWGVMAALSAGIAPFETGLTSFWLFVALFVLISLFLYLFFAYIYKK
jgi:hypothetical protein